MAPIAKVSSGSATDKLQGWRHGLPLWQQRDARLLGGGKAV